MSKATFLAAVLLISALGLVSCRTVPVEAVEPAASGTPAPSTAAAETPRVELTSTVAPAPTQMMPATPVEFSLETRAAEGKFLFVGVGGDIDGVVNPDLVVPPGATVHITLINGDGAPHDVTLPDFYAKTGLIRSRGGTSEVNFTVAADMSGTYAYFCSVPGHRKAGQEGQLVITEPGS